MASFEIQINGKSFDVDAPSQDAAIAAINGAKDGNLAANTGQRSQNVGFGAQPVFAANAVEGIPILGPMISGGADRAVAGIASAIKGTSYQDERARQEDWKRQLNEEHPTAATAGTIAGGVMGTVPMVAAAPSAFGVGPGGITAMKLAKAAATGAGIGGTDALARSGGDTDAIPLGAAFGGIAGAAGPVIGAGIGRVARSFADWRAQKAALDSLGISRPAADVLTRAGETDGAIAGSGQAAMQAAGPDAMLADAGPAFQNVLDTALQRGGPNSVIARARVDERAALAGQNLEGTLDQTLGSPRGIQTVTDDLRTSTATPRRLAYEKAYEAPIDYSSPQGMAIERLVKDNVPGKAIAQANALIRADPNAGPSRQILANIADDGKVTYERLPDVRQLDYITRGLKDVADAENGTGKLGGQTTLGRTYGNLASMIRGQLKSAVPEYANALETAAQPIAAREALDFGSEIFKPSVARDVAAATIKGMTGPELAAAKQGLRSRIAENFANVQRTITDPNVDARQTMQLVKQFSSDASMEKIGLLLGHDEMRSLQTALERAGKALELRGAIGRNSATFARTTTGQIINDAHEGGVISQAKEGKPLEVGKSLLQFLTQTRPTDKVRAQDATYGELADILTGKRGPEATNFLQRIQDAYRERAVMNGIAARKPIQYFGPGFIGGTSAIPSRTQ